MTARTLSVVVPVHDAAFFLPRQLDAIAAGVADPDRIEIVVVDNRSGDGSGDVARAWARTQELTVRVVAAPDRPGEPHARNVGVAAADGELVAFCDADDEVDRRWVSGMESSLATVDYVTGPVDTVRLNPPWLRSSRTELTRPSPGTTYGGVPFAHGCNMGFRRSTLRDLGGFDESFLIGCDAEIGVRAWRLGIVLGWEPSAIVHYRLRPSLRELYHQARGYGRVQPRLRALLDDHLNGSAERRALRRRLLWLIRSAPIAVTRPGRARWLWVAGRVQGEIEAAVRGRGG